MTKKTVQVNIDTFIYPLCSLWQLWHKYIDDKKYDRASAVFTNITGFLYAMQVVFHNDNESISEIKMLSGVINIQADNLVVPFIQSPPPPQAV
jgi:translation initiation factor IF-2